MFKVKDKKAFIFYFLMSIILVDFGNGIRKLSYLPKIQEFFDNSFISVMHIENTGGAFSIMQNQTSFLILLSIFTLAFISWHVYKEVDYNDKVSLFSLTLFSAGALGNLIERLLNGKVVDYFKLNSFNFPVFNAFDVMICLGIFIYTLFIVFELNILPLTFKKCNKDINAENSDNQ